ncbi:ABC transporter ATP-binding protein [Actinomarinicola tropica]|nr:ABC transporter ATP-binding protein [Actinomarinicola tropica]
MPAGISEDDKLDSEQAKHVLRRAARMMRPHRRQLWLAIGLIALYTLCILAGPYIVSWAIDSGITPRDAGVLNTAIAAYIVVALVHYVAQRTAITTLARVGETFLKDLRRRVFAHLQRLSMPFYDREKAGVIIARMTSDIDAMQELVQMGLLQFVSATMLLVLALILLFVMSWQLMFVCAIAIPFVVLASIKFQKDSNRAYLTVRDRIGSTLSNLQEGIAGVRVIQAFGRQEVESTRFAGENRGLYDAHMESVKVQSWYVPIIEFAGHFTTAIAIGVGGWMVTEDIVTIGVVAFFVLTLSNLFEPIQQLSQLFNQLQSSGAALQKLFELLDTDVDVAERPGAVDLPSEGEIEVRDVVFRYAPDGEDVLSGVNLTISPGERLALVGPTGAGKSTLAKLVARMYDPVEGTVSFGGVDLRDATLRSLRQRIVVVPQEGFLFHGTIRDNIRLVRPEATDADVVRALDALGLRERFEDLEDGLDTEVAERGSRLSAGEKQLVSLARAALIDPAVLVLDEATSSLDPGTEALVERALEVLMEGRTVIVIAHRLSTSERADRVGVVTEGTLRELGTHDELVAAGGHYAALYATWAGGLASTS